VDLIEQVRTATVVAPVGARTQWEVGGPPPTDAVEVHAPEGIVAYEPGDMTITVGAGTTFRTLDAALAEHGQECPLDPRNPDATVGGILACGLAGLRRLRSGPVRDHVLEVRVITGDARLIKGGGPTVKNVTGYDLPRLFVGSLGTLGVIVQATLRCRPRPQVSRWFLWGGDHPAAVRPSCRLWDGTTELVLLEGRIADVDAQARALSPAASAPVLPTGRHRGRISVAPERVDRITASLEGIRWCAERGVGTVHVASDDVDALTRARNAAHAHGGWMLREAGGASDDNGFGTDIPSAPLQGRIKDAFDPDNKLNPSRLPR
jgi:glycolate oxidase FAD binding subunit